MEIEHLTSKPVEGKNEFQVKKESPNAGKKLCVNGISNTTQGV